MAPETIYQTPPLAGRPPFATDDDSVYNNQPQTPTRRMRQPPPPDPNARTSAYNVYDNYMDEKGGNRDSGIGALGMGFMNGDMDDEDPFDDSHKATKQQTYPDEKQQLKQHYQQQQQPIPLAAPKPGYAAPVAALTLPSPAASPDGRQTSSHSPVKPLTLVTNMNGANPRVPPPAAINVPSTPHPLQPPMTPIMPIFARPAEANQRDVKFASGTPILRGDKEDTLLPRRQSQWGEKGDNFWRRFSMVVKVEDTNHHKESNWLKKTKNGNAHTSRWVWIFGVILLLAIAGGIGLGWWISHNNTTHSAPTAIGGSANQKALTTETAATIAGALATTSSPHVSPTHTVARRALPTPHIPGPLPPIEGLGEKITEKVPAGIPVAHKRHKRHALNRTLH
ncbi:hypothetical protein QCA50_006975 [Cerrena zonata]|uniref:Uncharacterized protein n=1 Tax=Cerrena zonata TaxID=2478898 RepID=A0AAW0GJA5_9APHY